MALGKAKGKRQKAKGNIGMLECWNNGQEIKAKGKRQKVKGNIGMLECWNNGRNIGMVE